MQNLSVCESPISAYEKKIIISYENNAFTDLVASTFFVKILYKFSYIIKSHPINCSYLKIERLFDIIYRLSQKSIFQQ